MKDSLKLIISITIPVAIGASAGAFTKPEIKTWYAQLTKPAWNPPPWLFGPVWTVLYILMGVALYIIWKNKTYHTPKRSAILIWCLQLAFNFLWSLVFFHLHQIGWALIDIGILWILIVLNIFSFSRISKPAAWLLVPYICWVSFAGLLNYAIWQLNT